MVLAYYDWRNAELLILDNLKFHIARALERRDLKPVYSFNGEGLWLSVARGQGKCVGDSGQIKHRQSLATCMQQNQG